MPTRLGLASAGVLALFTQVVYVTLVLLPEAARWQRQRERELPAGGDDDRGVLDLL